MLDHLPPHAPARGRPPRVHHRAAHPTAAAAPPPTATAAARDGGPEARSPRRVPTFAQRFPGGPAPPPATLSPPPAAAPSPAAPVALRHPRPPPRARRCVPGHPARPTAPRLGPPSLAPAAPPECPAGPTTASGGRGRALPQSASPSRQGRSNRPRPALRAAPPRRPSRLDPSPQGQPPSPAAVGGEEAEGFGNLPVQGRCC
ncbi:lysine-rich arabinogalactan protein 19-like [Miscanthus floridulus]|uniref:lysine-rich arabinogalactan protein 19-like n=1 Tax=Miscanthus floridulus TaxID=154761 RepID=UPI00345814AC